MVMHKQQLASVARKIPPLFQAPPTRAGLFGSACALLPLGKQGVERHGRERLQFWRDSAHNGSISAANVAYRLRRCRCKFAEFGGAREVLFHAVRPKYHGGRKLPRNSSGASDHAASRICSDGSIFQRSVGSDGQKRPRAAGYDRTITRPCHSRTRSIAGRAIWSLSPITQSHSGDWTKLPGIRPCRNMLNNYSAFLPRTTYIKSKRPRRLL